MKKTLLITVVPLMLSTPLFAKGLFTDLDADLDGALSPQEALKVSNLSQQFTTLDKNGDGKLDQMEFAAYKPEPTMVPGGQAE